MSETSVTPAPAANTKTLRVADPWVTSMAFPGDGESRLVVTREGTAVPAKDADALIQTAAEHGVTLTEVSES